jgi:hypothetical protein
VKSKTGRKSDLSQEAGLGGLKRSRRTWKPLGKAVLIMAASEEEDGASEVAGDHMEDNIEVSQGEAAVMAVRLGVRVAMVKRLRNRKAAGPLWQALRH